MSERTPVHAILPIAPPGSGKSTFMAALAQHEYVGPTEPTRPDLELNRQATSTADQQVWDTLRSPLLQGKPLQRTEEPSVYRLDIKRYGVVYDSCILLDYPGGRFFSPEATEPNVEHDLQEGGWRTSDVDTLTLLLFINHPSDTSQSALPIDLPAHVKAALTGLVVDKVVLYLAMADQVWPKRDFRTQLIGFNQCDSREQALALHQIMLADQSFIRSALGFLMRRQKTPPDIWVLAGSSYGALADGQPNTHPRTGALAQPQVWSPLGIMPVLSIATRRRS
jgi:hypothetical protein